MITQTEQLLTLGVPEDRIYIDHGFSGTTRRNRAGLDQTLAAVWNGSVFTVTKFDRFACDMAEANEILTGLSGRGVLFGLGASVYDWNDPFGRLFLQTLAMVAEFEANLGHLRTREGMALAKTDIKPHVNIWAIGDVDHGKTELTTAILKALHDQYPELNPYASVEEMDKTTFRDLPYLGRRVTAGSPPTITAERNYTNAECGVA
ncbi:recombinase family protein [Nonomuraea sp. NPDC052116]|uniref:recombinase family protein n=1 Tax=Nonomuraea sp. NPDC052116 TaxID=3155665 RepID=UPI0034379154